MNKPDRFSYHEVLDRLTMIQDQLESALAMHPVIEGHRKLSKRLHAVQDMLNLLRGEIWRATEQAFPEEKK